MISENISIELIALAGIFITASFGYLGTRAQVKSSESRIQESVASLSEDNSSQHTTNYEATKLILNTLQEHTVLIKELVSSYDKGLIKCDSNGDSVYMNLAALRMLGLTAKDIMGKNWFRYVDKDDAIRLLQSITGGMAEEDSFGPIVFKYRHPVTKSKIFIELMGTPVDNYEADESPTSWIFVTTQLEIGSD